MGATVHGINGCAQVFQVLRMFTSLTNRKGFLSEKEKEEMASSY
uniref:Uncharacterized protein n=1 Tax=Anguilla anguilla TaxID=7936 RepID=A0A0E9Q9Q2_ANGAN